MFNDGVELCVRTQTRADYYIEGGWNLLTGRIAGEWYDTFTINIADDISMTLDEDSSTDEFEYYTFEQGAFLGYFVRWTTSGAMSMVFIIDGDVDGESEVFDVIYLSNQPESCPENHAPSLFYEMIGHYECATGDFIDWYTYDDVEGWQVPVGDCYGIIFAYSNADCNWTGGNFYYDWYSEWTPVGDDFAEGEVYCSWFTSDGNGMGLYFGDPATDPTTYTWRIKVKDACQVDSAVVEVEITYIEVD